MRRALRLCFPLLATTPAAACNDDAGAMRDTAASATSAETHLADTVLTGDSGPDGDATTATTESDSSAETTPETTPETADDTTSGCAPGADDTCSSVQWGQLDNYAHPIDHHGTIVHAAADGVARLYVMGGFWQKADQTYEVYDEVRRAPITATHELGAWEDEAPLPAKMGFHGTAASADHVYLVAGISVDAHGIFATNDVYVGSFDGVGHLTFAAAANKPTARIHPSVQVVGARLLLIGGTRQDPIASVQSAPLAADGSVGVWTDDAPLPTPRSHHATAVHNGHVWVFGGFDETMTPCADILVSAEDADGRVTGWDVGGHMDKPPWTHGATVYKDGVFLIGGGEGGPDEASMYYVDRVRYARWDADGVLGPFVDVHDPLPRARSHVHQDPLYDGYLYSVGGRLFHSGASMPEVYIGYLAW